MARETPQMLVRMPHSLRVWLKREAKRNGSSQTSEVVRAIRERKERVEQEDAQRIIVRAAA